MSRRAPRLRLHILSLCLLALVAANSPDVSGSPRSNTIQARSGAGKGGEPAQIVVDPRRAEAVVLQVDDGSYETSIGIVATDGSTGSQAVYLNRFTPDPQVLPLTIDTVSILFPLTDGELPTGLAEGMPFQVLVYTDPSGSALPANTSLQVRQNISLRPSDTQFQSIVLDNPVRVESGDVWIGFTNTVTASDNEPIYPGAVDGTPPSQQRSWIFFHPQLGNHFDGFSLSDATIGVTLDQTSFPGNWLIRASGQGGATVELNWLAPDLSQGGTPEPRQLTARPVSSSREAIQLEPASAAALDDPGEQQDAQVVAYKVYRSSASPVMPSPGNLFATVPPAQTSARSSTGTSGSFFVVTACYSTGQESGPSNEASGGIQAATITKLKIGPTKIAATGSGFTDTVQVFLDNVAFISPSKVKKNNTKVVQKGTLTTGQTIGQYITPGRSVLISFRNSDGAVASIPVTGQ